MKMHGGKILKEAWWLPLIFALDAIKTVIHHLRIPSDQLSVWKIKGLIPNSKLEPDMLKKQQNLKICSQRLPETNSKFKKKKL